MRSLSFLTVVVILSLCASCKNYNIYESPSFKAYTHKRIAVLPFEFHFLTGFSKNNYDFEKFEDKEGEEGKAAQKYLYEKLLKWRNKAGDSLNIQDIAITNKVLSDLGLTWKTLRTYPKHELTQKLAVDEIIYGKIRDSRPVSVAENTARQILYGSSATRSSQIDVNIVFFNHESEKEVWRFDSRLYTRGIYQGLLDVMVKHLPY